VSGPRVFISYSWSSAEHEQWVLDLATQLRDNGVDAILDKWDLKKGHDANVFMEQMVTDPTVQKVIIVSDSVYAEKADGRRGGVGTETQILSPQIYAKAKQDKFVVVIPEVDADGKPFLPAYYRSRIFIDLSSEEIYPQNFEELVRWIFDKPIHPKPQIGKPPAYLEETSVLLPTRSRASRTIDLLQKGSQQSEASLREYFETLAEHFEALRLDGKTDPFDQAVIDSVEAFLPYRDEFVRVITTLARTTPAEGDITLIKRFFESVLPYCYPPSNMGSYSVHWFDNYKFIIHELFLYTVAVLLRYERYDAIDQLVTGGFYVGGIQIYSHQPIQDTPIFCSSLTSLEMRKQRLSLNGMSLQADLLKDRAKIAGVSFDELMQADFFLFMRDAADSFKRDQHNRWTPDTLIYASRRNTPFEIFARARSKRYFDKIKRALGVEDKPELVSVGQAFGTTLYIPRWNYFSLPAGELMGFDQLATAT
jgi:TIR domain